jgi:hypothetical protein
MFRHTVVKSGGHVKITKSLPVPPLQLTLHGRLAVCSDQRRAFSVSAWIMRTVTSGYRLICCAVPRFCSLITSTVP